MLPGERCNSDSDDKPCFYQTLTELISADVRRTNGVRFISQNMSYLPSCSQSMFLPLPFFMWCLDEYYPRHARRWEGDVRISWSMGYGPDGWRDTTWP